MQENEKGGLIGFFKSKDFRITLASVIIFLGIFLLISFLWLKWYTHHGQALEMPDFTSYNYEDAVRVAKKHKFRMSIQDSIHVLNKPGGEILKQNPSPGSLVKQNRMIYVTITKRSPDKILSGRLPEMYGKNYDRKKKELEEHFEIQAQIVDTQYDPGEAGQILEVRYHGKTIIDAKGRDNQVSIEKGDMLEFVISSKTGAKVTVPDLICKTYEEAQFLLENLGLLIGQTETQGQIEDLSNAFIINQFPSADGSAVEMNSEIRLILQANKPGTCE